jgi:DNA-binding PadR family transcriptional regulator
MRTTQIFVLGMLARSGPMHGHQLRRQAELERAEFWGKVKVSSLYAALHRMEHEGLVEAIERQQEGRFPARTVYAITAEGWRELAAQREACFCDTQIEPDPFDVALSFSEDLDAEYLRSVVEGRLVALTAFAENMERWERQVQPFLTPLNVAVFRHFKLRVQADVQWHQEFLDLLPGVLARSETPQSQLESGGT